MTDATNVTQADVQAAAIQWCGQKDRETSLDDIRYFQENWSALPGLRCRVEAFARHRTAAEAASKAEIAELVELAEAALDCGLMLDPRAVLALAKHQTEGKG